MKRCLPLVLLLALPLCAAELKVMHGKAARLEIPGITAAYSLDPAYADASVFNGAVLVHGRMPGETNIMAVTAAGVETIRVTVYPAPPVYPPG